MPIQHREAVRRNKDEPDTRRPTQEEELPAELDNKAGARFVEAGAELAGKFGTQIDNASV